MVNFTPVLSLIGGALIGTAASILLMLNGRIAGISGIVGGVFPPREGDFAWRVSFVAGLLVGGLVLLRLHPAALSVAYSPSLPFAVLAGVLVGVGTQLGSGCTSGHGVCGISRWSLRSMLATVTFIGTGALGVIGMKLIGGAR